MADDTGAENLVANGSFEDVTYERGHGRGHHRHHHHSRSAELSGWQVAGGPGPDVINHRWLPSADGDRHIELDGSGARNTNSAIFQDIPNAGTGTFLVSFNYSPPPFSRAYSNGIEIIWNGQVIDTISANGGWGVDWQTFTHELEGAGDLTRLEFCTVGADDGRGGYLDNVSVVAADPPPLFTETDDAVVLADDDPDYGSGEAYDALGGNDTVTGGDLDDTINGNTGNDTLSGGAGVDVMIGHGGSNRFVFDLAAVQAESGIGAGNRDTITDFDAEGADVVEFAGAVSFSFVGDETQDFSTGGGASGRFNSQTKILEIDSDGDQQVDMEIELQNVDGANLDDTDFTVS